MRENNTKKESRAVSLGAEKRGRKVAGFVDQRSVKFIYIFRRNFIQELLKGKDNFHWRSAKILGQQELLIQLI